MIEKKLEQLNTLKQLTLTQDEKGALRAAVARKIQMAESAPVESFWQQGVRHGLRIGLSTFLFIVFVGGSVSVVADSSLPGDPLYSFKVNVNEEIKGAFLNTPTEKLSWEKKRLDNRLNEIKTLASTQTLTKERQLKAQQALDSHLAKISVELETLSNEKPDEALKVTAEIQKGLEKNKEDVVAIVAEKTEKEKEDALKTVNETLKKLSDEELKIVSKEIKKIEDDLASVEDGLDTVDTPKDKEVVPQKNVTPLGP